jgi:serine/threonine protein kinase
MQINLKELPSETELKLVEREIKLHTDIDHPHIARLWETLFDGDVLYLIL